MRKKFLRIPLFTLLLSLEISIFLALIEVTIPVSAQGTWTRMADLPDGPPVNRGTLVYVAPYIYALNVDQDRIWRYDIGSNSWSSLALLPNTFLHLQDLVYPGTGDYLYDVSWRYNIASDSWERLDVGPVGELVRGDNPDSVYGGGERYGSGFWRYSISEDRNYELPFSFTWGFDTDLCYAVAPTQFGEPVETDSFIYAMRGYYPPGPGSARMAKYSLSQHRWVTEAAGTPFDQDNPALAWTGGGCLYAVPGGGSRAFWRYNLFRGGWDEMEPLPLSPDHVGFNAGVALVWAEGYIWAIQGGGSPNFWRYRPPTLREQLPPIPTIEANGRFEGLAMSPDLVGAWAGLRLNVGDIDFNEGSIKFEGYLIDPSREGRFVIVTVTFTDEILEYEVVISPYVTPPPPLLEIGLVGIIIALIAAVIYLVIKPRLSKRSQ